MTHLDEPTFERRGRLLGELQWERGPQTGKPREVTAPPTTDSLVWSPQPPTAEGWYFNRPTFPSHSHKPVTVLLVFQIEHGDFAVLDPGGRSYRFVQTMTDEWAGPIPEPRSTVTATT